ncbi:MAG: 2-isopropylmalate synthase, partial [Sporomusa sp.]|nr:2-isopropylmalate synthase [Sporomusa sp.]
MNSWQDEKWWVSPYNFTPEVLQQYKLPANVIIHDATLRDGEQTPGVVMSIEDKVEIAKMLDSIGVERIEAGMPAVSEADKQAISEISKLGLKSKIYTFARGKNEDIDMAVDCGADGVIIEMPTSVPKLKYQFPKWSEQDVIDISLNAVKYAKERGLEVVYFGYDTTRADLDFLFRLYDKIIEEGKPHGIGLVDTMGCLTPTATSWLVKKIKERYDVRVEIHTHNDYGMAVATSLAAIEAGAEVIHTCINGLGERTGNAALEPVLVALRTMYGIGKQYNLDQLKACSDRVEQISKVTKPVNQPFVGRNVYVRESGIGIDLVQERPLAMFAVSPELTGNKSGVVLGKKSGLRSIEVKLDNLGKEKPDETIMRNILNDVKNYSIEHCTLV